MAEVRRQQVTTITIEATTVGDVAKWLHAVEDQPLTTELARPVDLSIVVRA